MAIPIWQGRVSPVLDTAKHLMIVDIEEGEETARSVTKMEEPFPPARAARLSELDVDTLICGAVSRPLAALLAEDGVSVIPFTCGDIEEVLGAYLDGHLPSARFAMPGCRGRGGRFHRRSRGGRCQGFDRGWDNPHWEEQ